MGFWDSLTKTAVQDPLTGEVKFYDSPGKLGAAEAAAQAKLAQPAIATIDNQIPAPGEPVDPGFAQPTAAIPRIFKPSYQQASTDQMGLPTANTPGLTRLGKLIQVLGAAAKGAMAGQAASAQAVAASGGHRGGSFGLGFEAAQRDPFEDIAREQVARQGAMQLGMMQQQQQPVQTPLGVMPWWKYQQAMAMQEKRYLPTRGGGVFDVLHPQGYVAGTGPAEKERLDVPGVDVPFSPEVEAQKARIEQAKQDTKAGGEPKTPFQVWYQNFKDTNKREPSPKDITDFQRQSAQATHVTIAANQPTTEDMDMIVQGLVDGSLDVKGVFSRLAAPQRIQAIAAAKRIDPSFDMTTFPTRQKVAQDFGSGKAADQIQSFNTFLGHAKDLSDAVNDFRNWKSPLINKPLMWLRQNAMNDPQVASYLAKIEPVQKEFESFLLNNRALYSEDRKSAEKILDPTQSPAQMQAAIKSFVHTAAVRLNQVNNRYKNTFHKDYPGLVAEENGPILQEFGADNVVRAGGRQAATQGPPQTPAYPGVRFTPIQ